MDRRRVLLPLLLRKGRIRNKESAGRRAPALKQGGDYVSGLTVTLFLSLLKNEFRPTGEVRDYDISKKEWVLEGNSVSYFTYSSNLNIPASCRK